MYLYHFLLIKLALKADDATAPHLPITVKVASNYGSVQTRPATTFVDTPPPYPGGFQHDFFTRYQTPEDGTAMIQALHAQYPNITQLIPATFKTNGYRRNAMASMGCTVSDERRQQRPSGHAGRVAGRLRDAGHLHGRHGAERRGRPEHVEVRRGHERPDPERQPGDDAVRQPGCAEPAALGERQRPRDHGQPRHGRRRGLTSTAAQVVAALNANPAASAILWAATYRGNAGAGIVQPSAVVHLSDFLWAPRPGDAGVDPGYQIPRVPYQQYILRICKVCDGSKTGFFVYAQEHAREWVGPLVALETANRLLKNYGTDPKTTSYVDNLDIFIDPSVNTDGGNYSMLQGGALRPAPHDDPLLRAEQPGRSARRRRSTSFDPASRGAWGIDDNRGFSVGSLFDGYEGASSSCTSDTYAGPSELSQPEDKNEVALETQYPNIRFSMNIHTSGGYFMWSPASYKTRQPRGAAVPVQGLAGGVLGGGPQDGHRDQELPWHGRHPGPHGLGGRRAVLGRGQQLRRGLVQQEHHRLRLRVRRAPVLADLDLEQRW